MSGEKTTTREAAFRDYGEIWTHTVQKLDEMQARIEASLRELEEKSSDLVTALRDVKAQAELLASAYAGLNTVPGREIVLRLSSVLASYGEKLTRDGIDFGMIYRLLDRIRAARDDGFAEFPLSTHDLPKPDAAHETRSDAAERKRFRWITFERNRSRFIAHYRQIDIRDTDGLDLTPGERPDIFAVRVRGGIFEVQDLFADTMSQPPRPRHVLFLDGYRRNFAADRIGRRVCADHDIITPIAEPFERLRGNILTPGRVRLFGASHIILP